MQSCQLDKKNTHIGKIANLFRHDLCAFARLIDPSIGWNKQSKDERLKLEDKVSAKWEFFGGTSRVFLKYMKNCTHQHQAYV
jgi:hypothetical protein